MQVVLFEPSHQEDLYPFTRTRPVSALRKGIMTIRETWERIIGDALRKNTEAPFGERVRALNEMNALDVAATAALDFGAAAASDFAAAEGPVLFLNAALMPDPDVWAQVVALKKGEAFYDGDTPLAYYAGDKNPVRRSLGDEDARRRTTGGDDPQRRAPGGEGTQRRMLSAARVLRYPWELVHWNDRSLRIDFDLLTAGRTSQPVPPGNHVVNPDDIFLEEGAKVSFSVLNASTGPIYIGKNAEVMDGCLLRGPIALCEGSTLKMGGRTYGATTLGPYSAAGGEVKNVIMIGYSNKNHDGYLGDSLIGEWCNLGGGTSCSNVRNNAQPVKVWNPAKGRAEVAGLKAGLFMGDYSRCAIQTGFNTGAVVGVCCNVFGGNVSGYLPDFSWGLDGTRYDWEKALRDIDNWKKLKGRHLTPDEIQILQPIFAAV
ncbi:putative sugar nucleotidyl transferase [Dinghuibacter silviterrae]|uniref:UDP-N-acetylglucosamine diphosphorylase/glucosamine-1-phosphate N-acetyltransferase n=1 Tax=Dinghuibacter silviterrae TaxID=1539049 RepID=A0A4R8DV26_9BACT|nr:putative sugar nucleotidyl transferase [Dinghuibacter silviterrae]TDX02254.1 UDP-N-acetylglucosamine diphosphorylase/glucosamine-1-phosphate N-acetyltransferase [Dinghuibacter silviterrae]